MRTTIFIDEKLMRAALRSTVLKTTRKAVDLALRALPRLKKQAPIRGSRDKIHWTGDLEQMRSAD